MQYKSSTSSLNSNSIVEKSSMYVLDTLAQLPPFNYGNDLTLSKRAKSKQYTQSIIRELLYIKSPLHKYYQQAYYCNTQLIQSGVTLKGKYCNTRCCNVCNRIRTAKLMKGYINQLSGKQYFLTLTIPNIKEKELDASIDLMTKNITLIIRNLREKKKVNLLDGVRKLEVTFNDTITSKSYNTYHPHFHILVNSMEGAILIRDQWLKRYSNASIKAQDITMANEESLKELFKYSTKIGYKSVDETEQECKKEIKVNIKALDVIMRVLRGRRLFQPFGNIKKESEDVDGESLDAQSYNIPQVTHNKFTWSFYDWVDNKGQSLSCVEPPKFQIVNTSTKRKEQLNIFVNLWKPKLPRKKETRLQSMIHRTALT